MGKKVRTPTPPRPVQAPKQRSTKRARRAPPGRMLALLAAALLVLVGAVAAFLLLSGDSEGGGVAAKVADAGGTYREVDAAENILRPLGENRQVHVLALPKGFKYNTDPPSSGLHHPTTVRWGQYDTPFDQLQSVHNLEHGGLVIQYGPQVSQEDIGRLTEWYREDPNAILVAPLPRLRDKLSIAVWTFDPNRERERGYEGEGRLALLPRFDEGVFNAFRDDYRGRGPEAFRPEQNQPGGS